MSTGKPDRRDGSQLVEVVRDLLEESMVRPLCADLDRLPGRSASICTCAQHGGQHSSGCEVFRMEAPAYDEPCGVMRGDGSIPAATCVLPRGHEGSHYG